MANLLDRASVVLSPTAYNNGEALCIKPDDASGDFQFSRNSAATRVNAQGLVENVQILSSNLVQNGDFATDTSWAKLNATISGGTGNLNGTGVTSLLYQNILTNGKTYKVTFTALDYNGLGEARAINSNGAPLYTITSNGTFTFTFTHSNTSGLFFFRAKTGAIFSIDDVSVIEITTDTNLPRINYEGFSYDGSGNVVPDSGCGSWLWEPQSTNVITYSEDFSQWSASNVVLTNNIASPDGAGGAILLSGNGASSFSSISRSLSASGDVSYSLFVKKQLRDTIALRLQGTDIGGAGGTNAVYSYTFSTNSFASLSSASAEAFSAQSFSNGWIRLQLNFTSTTITTCRIYPAYGTSSTEGVYIWGAMLEENSYATSYIPTSGSSVTRNQDLCTNGGSLASINSTEGVLYAEIAVLANDGTARYLGLSDGTSDNRVVILYYSPINKIRFIIESEDVKYLDENFLLSDITEFHKVAISYKLNDFKVYVDGVLKINDTIGNTPIGLNVLSFDLAGSQPFFGKTKALAVWKEALSDAELTELTTI